jgi:hypothetical protein
MTNWRLFDWVMAVYVVVALTLFGYVLINEIKHGKKK